MDFKHLIKLTDVDETLATMQQALTLQRKTNMLSWGFATEGVCVRGGPLVAKADNDNE